MIFKDSSDVDEPFKPPVSSAEFQSSGYSILNSASPFELDILSLELMFILSRQQQSLNKIPVAEYLFIALDAVSGISLHSYD